MLRQQSCNRHEAANYDFKFKAVLFCSLLSFKTKVLTDPFIQSIMVLDTYFVPLSASLIGSLTKYYLNGVSKKFSRIVFEPAPFISDFYKFYYKAHAARLICFLNMKSHVFPLSHDVLLQNVKSMAF